MMQRPPICTSGANAIVYDLVFGKSKDFQSLGLKLIEIKQENVLEERRKTCFIFNNDSYLVFELSFTEAKDGLNGHFTACLSHSKSHLYVEDYLKLRNRDSLSEFSKYRDPNTDIRKFAETYLQKLLEVFRTDLKPILDGEPFESTPVDWGDYK